jgi:hypothetical protein
VQLPQLFDQKEHLIELSDKLVKLSVSVAWHHNQDMLTLAQLQ